MKVEISQKKLKERCEEIIANVNKCNEEYIRSVVRDTLIEKHTKRCWFKKIKPEDKFIDLLMEDGKLVKETWLEEKSRGFYYATSGLKWKERALKTLAALETIDNKKDVILTSDDDITMLGAWPTKDED